MIIYKMITELHLIYNYYNILYSLNWYFMDLSKVFIDDTSAVYENLFWL